jgi:hypothetical protein
MLVSVTVLDVAKRTYNLDSKKMKFFKMKGNEMIFGWSMNLNTWPQSFEDRLTCFIFI